MTNQLIKKKNNIFQTIFNKIKSFFYKNDNKGNNEVEASDIKDNETEINKLDSFKLSKDYLDLINLQGKIETGEESIADISEESAIKLIELYKLQNKTT